MKKSFNWKNIQIAKEDILSVLVLLPYFTGRILNKFLYFELSSDAYIMPTTSLMVLLTGLFLVLNLRKREKRKPRIYAWMIGLLIVDTALGLFFTQEIITSASVWLRLCLPMILSLLIVRYCRIYSLDFDKILTGMLKWFTVYTALMVLYHVLFRGLFTDVSVRFNPRGGGSVIFGYTVAVVFALALCVKNYFRPLTFYLILGVLTVAALATGSRGAVWPIAVLWVLHFIMMIKWTPKRAIIAAAVACVALLLIVIGFGGALHDFSMTEGNIFARLFRTGNEPRTDTFQNAVAIMAEADIPHRIFGFGTGSVFPILKFELEMQGGNMVSNLFTFQEKTLLVQPHNTLLYAFVENGWIGLILWLLLAFFICGLLTKNRKENKDQFIFQIVFVGTVAFVNMFDSIMYLQPGVAAVMWLMIWCVCERSQRKAELKPQD